MSLKLNKIMPGWYATPDGRYGVASDGLGAVTVAEREGSGISAGITGGEWCAMYDAQGRLREQSDAGENLNWFSTKREAVEYLARVYRAPA